MSQGVDTRIFADFIEEIVGIDTGDQAPTSTNPYRGANIIQYADGGGELYISFQVLLKFLDRYTGIISGNQPFLKVDWRSDKPFLAFSTSVSFNLKKCYLYNKYVGTSDGTIYQSGVFTFHPFTYFNTTANEIINNEAELEINRKIVDIQKTLKTLTATGEAGETEPPLHSVFPTVGNINYIYLNVDYLSKLIVQGSNNPENSLNIFNFLQEVCNGVNKSLGSLNDFQVIIDEQKEELTIVDFNQKRITGLTQAVVNRPVTTIKAQGLGSFVISLSAQSSITPDIATAIAIGAQANANRLGVEATTFSRLSRGFTDSFYTEKDIARAGNMTAALTSNTGSFNFEDSRKTYLKIIANQIEEPGKELVTLRSQDTLDLENTCVELYKALLGMFTEKNVTQTTYIPIKLDIKLKGISGIKIFERFTLSGDVLPIIYKNNYDFIVLGITQEVQANGVWVTTISAIITLKDS
jgi:hypothetical protein